MAKWGVTLPIAGTVYVEVDVDSEEEAIEKALNSEDLTSDAIESWEAMERIVEGNVCYAPQNRASADQLDDEE